ncbi:hypothetical protein QUA44_08120 [Microcoleus sp. N9_A2]|uniref:hypothetical protein n=2 Tax=Microcoleus TaxID=44471 RepID=UPI002FD0B830
MLIESLSIKSVSRFLMVGALALALILGGANLAKAESRDQTVDRLTDLLFYRVNPGLNNRKLQAGDRNYINEWQRLRAAIYPRVKPAQEVCYSPGPGDIGWEFTVINGETYEQIYDRLADIIFYSRHPQTTGQQISIGDKARSNQWLAIRREMYISNCGL